MKRYDHTNLIVRAGDMDWDGLIVEVTPEIAGWETIHFQSRRLRAGQQWSFSTGPHELALVMLSGAVDVDTSRGSWRSLGRRASVFDGLPHALYLPIHTELTVRSAGDAEFAVAWVKAEREREPVCITPADIAVEIRGGDHATRQINRIIPPGFPCERLVVVEVYTPGGNWSSYPPHKHDVHIAGAGADISEADLDEIYYYRIDRPEGYALQRVYTGPDSPLHRAGAPLDAVLMPGNDDVVLVPEGYHPVSSPPGYTTYYLNVLAGSAQSLAATDDPQFAWVKGTFRERDPRVPVYDISEARLVS